MTEACHHIISDMHYFSGFRFGPKGGKRLIYFVDDMNMPHKDKYETQSAIELLRQLLDYHGWYDKVGL